MNKESVFVSAVVYTRDDADCIVQFIRSLSTVFNDYFNNYEIIVVDDCSSEDIKKALINESSGIDGCLSIVRMSYPQGIQAALNAGVDIAIGDFVFEFERTKTDFNLSLIMDIFYRELEGYDIVSAVPEKGVRLSSRLFYSIFNKSSGSRYPLSSESFRIVSRRAINRIGAMSDVLVYRKAFYRNSGLKCDIIKYDPIKTFKTSSLPEERSRLAIDSLILFTSVAYKLSLFMTVLMMSLAAFGGIYTLIIFFLGKPIEGWTTMMLLISAAFFGVFAILTIVIKYLSVLVSLVFTKSRYIIEGIDKLS